MSQSTPPLTAIRLLPIGETIVQAYQTVFDQRALLARAIAFPYLLSIVISLIFYVIPPLTGWLPYILATWVFLFPYTFFGVTWHRLTLLGPAMARPPWVPACKRRHLFFFVYAVLVVSIYSAPMTAYFSTIGEGRLSLADAGIVVFWVLSVLMMVSLFLVPYVLLPYLMMRFCFVFPAVALDEKYGLRHSWKHSRKQGFRLLGLVIAAGLPAILAIWVLQYVVDTVFMFGDVDPSDTERVSSPEPMDPYSVENVIYVIVFNFLMPILHYLPIAFVVSAISIAFRTCTGWVPGVSTPPAQSGASD